MNRRDALKSIAAVGLALTGVNGAVAAPKVRAGEFVGRQFVLKSSLVINRSNVTFRNCTFVLGFQLRPGDSLITIGPKAENVVIENVSFVTRLNGVA